MSKAQELITHVAINHDDSGRIWSLPAPYRHHHVLRVMAYLGEPIPVRGTQGFLTNSGEFLMRKAAAHLALNSGQASQLHAPPNLFSEDLW